jgi:octaprenyl-diphosphate synthase
VAVEWTGVDRRIADYEREFGGLLARLEGEVDSLLRRYSGNPLAPMLGYAMAGGKRLRPLITVLVNESLGPGAFSPYQASMIPELLHVISVVHDDIIDEEQSRRGRPPFHAVYGVGRSLVLADFAFSIILDIASSYGRAGVPIMGQVSRAAMMMAEGEEREMDLISRGGATRDEYREVVGLKTASLFQVAAELGAALSASPGSLPAASSFGWHFGVAYQLADDLEDMGRGRGRELVDLVRPALSRDELLDSLRSECSAALGALGEFPPGGARDRLSRLVGFLAGSAATGRGPAPLQEPHGLLRGERRGVHQRPAERGGPGPEAVPFLHSPPDQLDRLLGPAGLQHQAPPDQLRLYPVLARVRAHRRDPHEQRLLAHRAPEAHERQRPLEDVRAEEARPHGAHAVPDLPLRVPGQEDHRVVPGQAPGQLRRVHPPSVVVGAGLARPHDDRPPGVLPGLPRGPQVPPEQPRHGVQRAVLGVGGGDHARRQPVGPPDEPRRVQAAGQGDHEPGDRHGVWGVVEREQRDAQAVGYPGRLGARRRQGQVGPEVRDHPVELQGPPEARLQLPPEVPSPVAAHLDRAEPQPGLQGVQLLVVPRGQEDLGPPGLQLRAHGRQEEQLLRRQGVQPHAHAAVSLK